MKGWRFGRTWQQQVPGNDKWRGSEEVRREDHDLLYILIGAMPEVGPPLGPSMAQRQCPVLSRQVDICIPSHLPAARPDNGDSQVAAKGHGTMIGKAAKRRSVLTGV